MRRIASATLILTVLLASCCQTSTPEPEPPTDQLAPEERATLDTVTPRVLSALRVFGALAPLRDGLVALNDDVAPAAQECPAVAVIDDVGVTTVALDYGAALCVNAALGGLSVQGRVHLDLRADQTAALLSFADFAIDSATTTGGAELAHTVSDVGDATLVGPASLSTADTVSFTGVQSVTFEADGQMRVDYGFWDINTATSDIELGNTAGDSTAVVVVLPTDNPDFIPHTGVVAFWMAPSRRVVLTFDADTPLTRVVSVTVDERGPFEYLIPPLN